MAAGRGSSRGRGGGSADAGVLRVGLLWHSANSGNLGVGALTVANIALAREAAASVGLTPRFTIMGMRDAGASFIAAPDVAVHGIDTRDLLSPGGSWATIGEQDCLIDIGLGDSFADIYGPRRFFFLWGTKMQAILRRRPLLLSPQTIGPFTREPYRMMARAALEGADQVFARDTLSLEALRSLAPAARAQLSVDVAFALPFETQAAMRGGPRTRVGVNVSGLLFDEAQSGANRFGLDVNYADLMRRFIGDLAADPAFEVHLIRHVTAPPGAPDNDGPVAGSLAEAFPNVVLAPIFDGPSAAKSYISGLDFLAAGRMHACIAAFSSGVPVIPVAYSRKFSGLFGMLGYPWLVPVTGVDTAGALAFLHDGLRRRDTLASDVAVGMAKVDGLLDPYRAALSAFFAAAAGR